MTLRCKVVFKYWRPMMKKFAIMNKLDDTSIHASDKIKYAIMSAGFIEDEQNPELVIIVGGDGTMLRGIRMYRDKLDQVKFVGLHTGTLGFYTDYQLSQIDDLIDAIIMDMYDEVSFELLEAKVKADGQETCFYAVNEARVENNTRTQVLEVYINDELFEIFRGTGLNFSTATGSTGYNKSIGGPVVHPKLKAYIMSEVAGINNREFTTLQSSLVLTSRHVTKVTSDDYEGMILGFDSKSIELDKTFNKVECLEFYLSSKKVTFVRYKAFPFVRRVQKNFISK